MNKFRHGRWFLVMLLLALPFLACRLGSQKEVIPQPPSGHIEPNQEASKRVQENFNQAMQEASGNNEFRFRVSNEEITSIVAANLEKRPDIPFSKPQIWFTAGKIYVTGLVEGVGPTSFSALIVGVPKITPEGQLEIEIDEAKMGNLDLPENIVESLSETVNETLADLQLDIQITAIEVLEGEMLIAGKRLNN
jgi:hypothetical protein